MPPIIQVILLLAEKYIKTIDVTIDRNTLILEYLKNDKVYKTITIDQCKNKLVVNLKNEKITKVTDLDGIAEILSTIEKQVNNMGVFSANEIKNLKEKYKSGTKIELIKMYDLQPLPAGTIGIVDFVDDIGTIHMKWANGSSLGLVETVDEFKILEENGVESEQK